MDGTGSNGARIFHLWRVGTIEYDERTGELRVDGERRALQPIPGRLFTRLLQANHEIVSKDELVRAGWRQGTASDQSLQNAISKLREAIGDEARDLIDSKQGEGYWLTKPVTVSLSPAPPKPLFFFTNGDTVPGRPQWRLTKLLASPELNDVWLAVHDGTSERRVFKFAETPERIQALLKEMALSRRLRAKLGDSTRFAWVIDGDFEAQPAYIESEYGGTDLQAWAEEQGGLNAIPLAIRLAIVADAASALAPAHDVLVLHGDLKPGNILVSTAAEGMIQVKLADFSAGGVTEAARSELINTSLEVLAAKGGGRPGTEMYLPPEPLADGDPTIAADIYALGILLYHMVIGDFGHKLTPQWERNVADPLLRQDIKDAAAEIPAERLRLSAAALADRLRTLDKRRLAFARAQKEAERQRRRPFVIAVVASLVLGLAVAAAFGARAAWERDEALRQTRNATEVLAFLTNDLLGQGNPADSGKPDETLMEAAADAAPRIKLRLSSEPLVAAAIYRALATAYDGRGAYDAARAYYQQAERAYYAAEGPNSPDAIILELREAFMETISGRPDWIGRARSVAQAEAPRVSALKTRHAEAEVWLYYTDSMASMIVRQLPSALRSAQAAADLAATLPDAFDESFRLDLQLKIGYFYVQLGQWDAADKVLPRVLQADLALHGPRHPATLMARYYLAMELLLRGKNQLAANAFQDLYPAMANVFGVDYRYTKQALMLRAQAEIMLEQYADGARDDLALHAILAAQHQDNSLFAMITLSDAAVALCRSGHADEGTARAEQSHAIAVGLFGANGPYSELTQEGVAFCLIISKRYRDAEDLLNHIDPQIAVRADNTGSPAQYYLMQAYIAKAAGNPQRARALLKVPERDFATASSEPYMHRWTEELAQSLQ